MGSGKVDTSGRSVNLDPHLRADIERSRKRFQCDLFGFWRQCKRAGCRQRHGCTGDPFDCFERRRAAMPPDHECRLLAEVLSLTTGTVSSEQAMAAVGLSMPRVIWAGRGGPAPPHQAVAAAPAVEQRPESEDARLTRRRDELLRKLAPQGLDRMEAELKELGITVKFKTIDWGLPGDKSNCDVDPTAGLPRPADAPSAGTGPASSSQAPSSQASLGQASLGQADEVTAGPSPPKRPPGIEPWQAWCDDEGRLHVPDPAAVKERHRMMTRDEVAARMRAYGREL